MTINNSILGNLLPQNFSNLLEGLKNVVENEHHKTLTYAVNNEIEVTELFKKENLKGLGEGLSVEFPLRLILKYNSTLEEKQLKVKDREILIDNEYKTIENFVASNKNCFETFFKGGDIDQRGYILFFKTGCFYSLWENKEILDIQSYIFRSLGLNAA